MNSNPEDQRRFAQNRAFLKDTARQQVDFTQTAQVRRLPAPPLQKPYPEDGVCFALPDGAECLHRAGEQSTAQSIINRESIRDYSETAISLKELSALLYATQGIKKTVNGSTALRTVPSAGARHAFESYLAVMNVTGLKPGLYRYLPVEHKLLLLETDDQIGKKAASACLNQAFVAKSAVTFFWTALPYRMEWRYDLAAHKVILLDAGHVCQNLYLAANAMRIGVCAVAAYDQEISDELLRVDGREEFTVYMAPAGKMR